MRADTAIIQPLPGKQPTSIGRSCVMAAHPSDLDLLVRKTGLLSKTSRNLLNSRLYYGPHDPPDFCIVGPFIGAPYGVMLMETVIAWGIAEIVFMGWCGAVSDSIRIGDIILPQSALIDEGTSRHYIGPDPETAHPDMRMQSRIKTGLLQRQAACHEGIIWCTDAIFRETHEKVGFYRSRGALAVEMEASALFSVAMFRSVPIGCVLVVSDEISSGRWIKGFDQPRFKNSRRAVAEVICDLLADPGRHGPQSI
jgi:purine-nucleoside phosphorylase